MWPRKKKAPKSSPETDPTSIGNLVIREGLLTQSQLSELLHEFHESSIEVLLGKFLVSKGVMTEEKLELLLLRQSAERSGGVEHEHVMRALKIADSSQKKLNNGMDRFNESATSCLAKVKG